MPRRLPSLNGLRAFEASGRHGSFTGAARELNVTQTAVSRLVRLLEARLGFALFTRQASALELTAQGEAMLAGLTDAFDAIAHLTEQVTAMRQGPVLTVGVGPTLAVHWLIPRLAGFHRRHPDIEVRIATGGASRPVSDDWTCTIRRDEAVRPGYVGEELFASLVMPVCRPEFAGTLPSPEHLGRAQLIHVSGMPSHWPHWFAAAGLATGVISAGEVTFESSAMAVQAALDGVGVALADIAYVGDALRSGRLVAPFPTVVDTQENWRLQYRPARRDDPALTAFRAWLLDEAEEERGRQHALVAAAHMARSATTASSTGNPAGVTFKRPRGSRSISPSASRKATRSGSRTRPDSAS
jgi:LysR family transcriptional regulator, regulator of gene expression of beta-lactamase